MGGGRSDRGGQRLETKTEHPDFHPDGRAKCESVVIAKRYARCYLQLNQSILQELSATATLPRPADKPQDNIPTHILIVIRTFQKFKLEPPLFQLLKFEKNNMKLTLAAAATILLASQASATLTTTVDELRTDFASHIKTHNKVYDSEEYERRFQQYRKNKQFVDAHNANA